MSVVAVFCSKTGMYISTGLEMDPATFASMPVADRSLDCWACGGSHLWSRRWASLIECDDLDRQWAGAPIHKARRLMPT